MNKRTLSILFCTVVALLAFASVALAQDATATPMPEGAEGIPVEGINLESITADAASYYGQQVTIEGVVEEILNVRAFILGEAAELDNDQILVINTTGEDFDLRLTSGARVIITGTIYPSREEGGFEQLISGAPAMAMTPEADLGDVDLQVTDEAGLDAGAAGEAVGDAAAGAADAVGDAADAAGDAVAGADMQATEEAGMTEGQPEATQAPGQGGDMGQGELDLSGMIIPERLNNFTLMMLESVGSIQFIELPQ